MYFKRAKILSYDAAKRTAQVHIHGLTDGASQGLTATFAYPVGDDDRDTERQIVLGNDVYVFFEDGDESCSVIAFYSSHGTGPSTSYELFLQGYFDNTCVQYKTFEELENSPATLTFTPNTNGMESKKNYTILVNHVPDNPDEINILTLLGVTEDIDMQTCFGSRGEG